MAAADHSLEQAHLRLKLQDFSGAIADYSRSLDQEPSAPAYYGRAMAYLSLGQGAAAAIDAQQALTLQPQWPAAWRLLGKARALQRDWSGAIAAYEQAIAAYAALDVASPPVAPEVGPSSATLGTPTPRLSTPRPSTPRPSIPRPSIPRPSTLPSDRDAEADTAAAIAQCRDQIRQWQKQPQQLLAPEPPPLLSLPLPAPTAPVPVPAVDSLGSVAAPPAATAPSPDPIRQTYLQSVQGKIDQGDYQAALEDVHWVLQLDPHDLEAIAQRGIVLGRLGRTQEAFRDFERFLQQSSPVNPLCSQIYKERARLRLKLGDNWGTVQDCDRWLEQSPDAVIAWVLRAKAKARLQQWGEALADYDRAIALAPQQPDLYEGQGDVYAAQAAAQDMAQNTAQNTAQTPVPAANGPDNPQPQQTAAITAYRQGAMLWLNRGDRANHDRLQAKIEQLLTPPAPDRFQVPILARSGSSPILAAVFDDRVTLEMVLDTGCTTTLLTAAQARMLGVVATGRQYTRVADGRVVEMGKGWVRSVSVGGATVRDLEVLIGYDRGAEEGLLGQNFFCHFELRIRTDRVEFIPLPPGSPL